MRNLPTKPTLADYQQLICALVVKRGFEQETVPEVFTLLVEGVGELAKAIRKPIDLYNRLGIDLAQAFRAKELNNQKRKWV